MSSVLCYKADIFMFPDTIVIFDMRCSRWLLVLCNGFSISKGGGEKGMFL
jgi:hypothetical protein